MMINESRQMPAFLLNTIKNTMKILKLLNEAQSTLFHYTSIHALHKILSSKTIRLSVQRMTHEQDIAKVIGQGDKSY
jgi:hypothetical protein